VFPHEIGRAATLTSRPDFSLIVAFGTDMGNAEDAAMSFAEAVEALGVEAEAVELNQVDVADLQTTTHFIAVTSTFGDGEFPDNAVLFWEALQAHTERLDHLSFAVLALGDVSYDLFCNAGKLLDERLETLGATRLVDRVDIDGFYEKPAAAWTADVVKMLAADCADPGTPAAPTTQADKPARERNDPVEVRLAVNRLLTTAQSDKEVRHYEIDLADTGIAYQAGDSVAVHATNDPVLVDALITELGAAPDDPVDGHDEPLGIVLGQRLEIRTPSRALQVLAASRTPEAENVGHDVLDLVRLARLNTDEVVETLRPLQFRDYSIASSPLVHPDHVHLTVATVSYTAGDRRHGGVASTFLADRAGALRVHLRPNNAFRLPDSDVPIIMIGPGTGIAPFRAFLQERQAVGASGRSWLFFGARRRSGDYLYGDELHGFVDSGTLTRLDVAFSRDQDTKVYVQQHMSQNGAQLYAWLQDGAHLYVCGDEKRMAKDVDATLHQIVARHGAVDADAAHVYVNELIKSHRYVRDVY
jgi:sulfite reductase (NADPH) flavoprotein alpha-component